MHIIFILLLMFISNLTHASTIESLKLTTPRGTTIDAVIHYPDTAATVPAVIIGAGQGYHMGLPIIEGLAKKISEKGYATIRFNWSYFSQKGQPSDDLSKEVEDYATVIAYAKNNSKIDKNNIIASGKSLGSIVSYNYFELDNEIKALVLMTPICTRHWDDDGKNLPSPIEVGHKNYPNLVNITKPIVIALGNNDSLCSVTMLNDFLKDSKTEITKIIVEGDHSLNLGPWDNPAFEKRNAENIELAISLITNSIAQIVNEKNGH